jgi:hypothetical protein
MAETKVIKKAEFKREWTGPNGVVNYHDVWFEGDTSPWNLGAKDKNPDFLKAGAELTFEVKDAAKRSIKRITEIPQRSFGAKTPFGGGSFSQVGVTVGAGLNQAVQLVANGKAELKDIKSVAHRLIEIAFELKEEFKDKG